MKIPKIVAHRGDSRHAVGNTLGAFEMAADKGADMIELDIRQSADGHPVVYHDSHITLHGDCDTPVDRLLLGQLLTTPLASQERIPALEEVLMLCRSRSLGLYVEFKDAGEAVARTVINQLRRYQLLESSILFSNRPDHIFLFKQIDANAQTALSYRNAGIDPVALAGACRADGLNIAWEDYVHPVSLITPDWLRLVRSAGLRIMSWHEEREQVLNSLIKVGIDDICTNDPALVRRWVVEQVLHQQCDAM